MGNQASVETQTFLGYLGGVDISMADTKAAWHRHDRDRNGVLSGEEIKAFLVDWCAVHKIKYTELLHARFMTAFDSNQDGEINWSEMLVMPRDFNAICILCHKVQVEGAMMLKKQAGRHCPLCPNRHSLPYTHHRHCEPCALRTRCCMVCGQPVRKFQMRVQLPGGQEQKQHMQQHAQQVQQQQPQGYQPPVFQQPQQQQQFQPQHAQQPQQQQLQHMQVQVLPAATAPPRVVVEGML